MSLVRIGRLRKVDIERKVSGRFSESCELVSDKGGIAAFVRSENLRHISFKATEHIAGGESSPIGGGNCIICPVVPISVFSSKATINSIHTEKPYQIEIFNFYGQKVLTKTVISVSQENQVIGDLPKNMYIIKSKNGDRKVSN